MRLFPTLPYGLVYNRSFAAGIGYPRKAHDMLIGDRAYFKNPDVHPETMWLQGENVIVLAEDLYYGHGIGIANAETFIEILNRNRKEGLKKRLPHG